MADCYSYSIFYQLYHINNQIPTCTVTNTSFTRARLPGLAQFGSTWLDKNPRVNGQKTNLFQTELAGKNNQATRLRTAQFA